MTYLDDIAARIRQELPDDAIPAGPAGSHLLRLYALLARIKGVDVTAEDVHDAWATWKAMLDPDHAALLPYPDLQPATRGLDEPYAQAIRKVAAALPR